MSIKWMKAQPGPVNFFRGGYATHPCRVHPSGVIEYGDGIDISNPELDLYIYGKIHGIPTDQDYNGSAWEMVVSLDGSEWALCDSATTLPIHMGSEYYAACQAVAMRVEKQRKISSRAGWGHLRSEYTDHLYAKMRGEIITTMDIDPILRDFCAPMRGYNPWVTGPQGQ